MNESGGFDSQDLHKVEQAMAMMADTFPPHWKRMYDNLLAEGFDKDQSFRILLTLVHGTNGGRMTV